jgi:hypothetical protein
MMDLLEAIKTSLATIPGVTSCRIGLEDNITPDDYPLIRIVPSNMQPGQATVSGTMLTRRGEILIYFGMPVQPFDDTADGSGRVRLEKVYAALFDLEADILTKLMSTPAGILAARYRETITDEDRLDTYKLMAIRCEVEG